MVQKMKVIAISRSPREGRNSDPLQKKALDGAASARAVRQKFELPDRKNEDREARYGTTERPMKIIGKTRAGRSTAGEEA